MMSSQPSRELPQPDESRFERKRRAIVDAARTVFLSNGYLGATMDEIAALASVSKQTVYKRFADKEALFREVVIGTVDRISDPNAEQIAALKDTEDLEADLLNLAEAQLERVLQPQVLQLRRLVIGESGRFPELGRTFSERGPGRTMNALAGAFEALASRRLLEAPDPDLAAQHFNWLIMSVPLNRAMLEGDDRPPSAARRKRFASSGVKVFLDAYGRS